MLSQNQKPNLQSTAPNKGKHVLDFFRVILKKLFENTNKDSENISQNKENILFSKIVNSSFFGNNKILYDDWQKNLDQFLNNIGLQQYPLDENAQKHLLHEQQNMSIKDYNLDELSFTTGWHELSIELMIEDLQPYLGSKNNIFLVDIFSGTYSIPGVIKPFQKAYGLLGYLGIDMQDALHAESTQKVFLDAVSQGVEIGFLQTDAYSGLCLLPDKCVDVLLINGVDYTITSDTYMGKVIAQAKKVLKNDGIISGIGNSFLHSPLRTQTHMQGYQIHQLGANSYCKKK